LITTPSLCSQPQDQESLVLHLQELSGKRNRMIIQTKLSSWLSATLMERSSTKESLLILYSVSFCTTCIQHLYSKYTHIMDAAVSLLNIRETHRFSVQSWRLAALLPSGVRTSTSEQKTKIWHRVVGAMFQNYNSLLNQNHYVKCSDGQVRNIAMVLSMWQGDGPEIATACSLIQVCTVCVLLLFEKSLTVCCSCTGKLPYVLLSQGSAG